jgi:hypothetical protein
MRFAEMAAATFPHSTELRDGAVTAQPGEAVGAERNEGTNGDPDSAFCNACNTLCPCFRAVEI